MLTIFSWAYLTKNLQKYLMENLGCLADWQNIYADQYQSMDRQLITTGLVHWE